MEAEDIEIKREEDKVIMSLLLEKTVIIPDDFSIYGLARKNYELYIYQSFSPEIKDEYFAPKEYSGMASLKIEPAIDFIDTGEIILPGLGDAMATLSALHMIVRDDPGLIYAPGFRNIIIPVPSTVKLRGEFIYLMLSHVELFKKDLGWKLGIIFDWKTSERVSNFHVAYLDVPF
jgi:hypothetical protein